MRQRFKREFTNKTSAFTYEWNVNKNGVEMGIDDCDDEIKMKAKQK